MSDPNPEISRLLQGRPSCHRAGSFPREYLPKGEAVLFETRPSLWPYVSASVAGAFLAVLVAALLIWIGPQLSTTDGATLLPTPIPQLFAGLLLVLALLVVVGRFIGWYFTSYAMTNRRIVRKEGWGTRLVVDARFEKIQAVSLVDTTGTRAAGFGTLTFILATSPSLGVSLGFGGGSIRWFAIPEPLRVRAFAEDTFETFARFDREGTNLILEES